MLSRPKAIKESVMLADGMPTSLFIWFISFILIMLL